MRSIAGGVVVLAFLIGGAGVGMVLRRLAPRQRLEASIDSVRLIIGLVITMSSLILGFMVTASKAHFDIQKQEVAELSAKVVVLDHLLAHYGPETKVSRAMLRTNVVEVLGRLWRGRGPGAPPSESPYAGSEALFDSIQDLDAKDSRQRAIQASAATLTMELGRLRWLEYAQAGDSFSLAVPGVLVAWFVVIFLSFGLCCPPHPSVVTCLVVAALTVSSAILLMFDLYHPFEGLIVISDKPLRDALMQLGK